MQSQTARVPIEDCDNWPYQPVIAAGAKTPAAFQFQTSRVPVQPPETHSAGADPACLIAILEMKAHTFSEDEDYQSFTRLTGM